MTSVKSARAIADLADGVILATVDIEAAPDAVFRALTDPAEISRWWGSPDTYKTEKWTADFRVGGAWKAEGRSADGKSFSVFGEYLEIDPPNRLVQTWKADWDGHAETRLTYLLQPIEGGTRLTLRHEGFAGRPQSCEGHTQGWELVLGWLAGRFHADTSSEQRFYLCRLLPPRPSFAQDMNAEEAAMMREHAAYWSRKLEEGVAIVFGPVADPKGVWGLGVIRAASDEAVRGFEAGDPVMRAGAGFRYEILPMMRAVAAA